MQFNKADKYNVCAYAQFKLTFFYMFFANNKVLVDEMLELDIKFNKTEEQQFS